MPQLPSGLRLAIDAEPLHDLFRRADQALGRSLVQVMELDSTQDLEPLLRFLWLKDREPRTAAAGYSAMSHSLPLPEDIVPVFSGYTVAQWDAFAQTLSAEDAAACAEFLASERHQLLRQELLEELREVQDSFLHHATESVRLSAHWAQAGVHPLQTGETAQGFWEGAFDEPDPTLREGHEPMDDAALEDSNEGPLGHGEHWWSLGLEDVGVMELVADLIRQSRADQSFVPPWDGDVMTLCQHREISGPELSFVIITGQQGPTADWELVSGYPVVTRSSTWELQVHELCDDYGAFEGLVRGQAKSFGGVQWFAPRFGLEVAAWEECQEQGRALVDVAGIAMSMQHYAAEPIIIKDGPLVDARREELRAEGRHAEAEDPELSVTFTTTEMRSLFSNIRDHCEYVGRILYVDDVAPRHGVPAGWWVQLECLPEHNERARSLPVLVFPPALPPGYVPAVGDRVCGVLWLQGSNPRPLLHGTPA